MCVCLCVCWSILTVECECRGREKKKEARREGRRGKKQSFCVCVCVCVCVRVCVCVSHSVVSDSLRSRGLQPPVRSPVRVVVQARILEWVAHSFILGSPQIEHLKQDLLCSWLM